MPPPGEVDRAVSPPFVGCLHLFSPPGQDKDSFQTDTQLYNRLSVLVYPTQWKWAAGGRTKTGNSILSLWQACCRVGEGWCLVDKAFNERRSEDGMKIWRCVQCQQGQNSWNASNWTTTKSGLKRQGTKFHQNLKVWKISGLSATRCEDLVCFS